jgi:hypothetical protein
MIKSVPMGTGGFKNRENLRDVIYVRPLLYNRDFLGWKELRGVKKKSLMKTNRFDVHNKTIFG